MLTDEQRQFATEHHNLIYGFMRLRYIEYKEWDDWYGVIAIGYIQAVESYKPDECEYPFSSWAYRKMHNAYCGEKASKKRDKQCINNDLISLDKLRSDENTTSSKLLDSVSDMSCLHDDSDFSITFNIYFSKLSEQTRKIIVLRLMGYTMAEIGIMFFLSKESISKILRKCRNNYTEFINNTYICDVENDSFANDFSVSQVIKINSNMQKMTTQEIIHLINEKRISINNIEKYLKLSNGTLNHRFKKNLSEKWKLEILEAITNIESERRNKINADIECIMKNVDINTLSDRDKDVIHMYKDGVSLQEIADKHSITDRRVKQILDRFIGK